MLALDFAVFVFVSAVTVKPPFPLHFKSEFPNDLINHHIRKHRRSQRFPRGVRAHQEVQIRRETVLVTFGEVDFAALHPASEDGEGVVVDVQLSVPGEKIIASWERVAKRREWVVRRWVGRVIGWREEVQRIVIWEGWVGRS